MNAEIKEQSNQWMHTHKSEKPTKFKQTLSYKNAYGNCFLGQERVLKVDTIHARRGHNNITSVLRNTKNAA
jgi:hypothetical protein